MKRCPITYDNIDNTNRYSEAGLRLLSRNLKNLLPFPYTMEEQRKLALEMATKISIQGVHPKISARLDNKKQTFIPVERQGNYILKPQNIMYPHLPENEDVTMRLAAAAGLEVPVHGLLWSSDGQLIILSNGLTGRGKPEK